jgi:ASC-1-like (ASCH) protein
MDNSKSKKYVLRFRAANKDIFDAIKEGKKKIETRAATKRYRNIKEGDVVILTCGAQKFEKIVCSAHIYKTIRALLRSHKPKEINPRVSTESELIDIYYSFPDYREKIKKFGLIALELK